jgi:hypothetical protein
MHATTVDRPIDKPDRAYLQYGNVFEEYKERVVSSNSVRLHLCYYWAVFIFR